jgi:predicted RNA polymerase sigma factor
MGDHRPDLIEFLLRERDLLLAQLAHRLGSAGLAEEVLQQTLLQLRCLPAPPAPCDPRRYLLTFATQLGIDRMLRECAAVRVSRQLADLRWRSGNDGERQFSPG